jgi:hypothetical protein
VWTVSEDPIPPEEESGRGTFCPYCESWEYWVVHPEYGIRICPICRMSESDYHVKLYNHLFHSSMKSKTAKKKEDRMRKRTKRI